VDVFDCDGGGWIAVCFCREQLLLVNETETDYIDDVVETWPHGLLVVFGSNTGMFQQVLCIRTAVVHCASRAYLPLPAFAVVSGILLRSRVSTSSIIRTSSHLVRHTEQPSTASAMQPIFTNYFTNYFTDYSAIFTEFPRFLPLSSEFSRLAI
jgi:hypothetical protein